MFPFDILRIFPRVHCDSDEVVSADTPKAVRAFKSVKNAMSVPETELKRWRRVFDSHATTVSDGQKCVLWRSSHTDSVLIRELFTCGSLCF